MRRFPRAIPALLGALFIAGAVLTDRLEPAPTKAAEPVGRGQTHTADAHFPRRALLGAADSALGAVISPAVIGQDERIQISDTSVYPWRAIAHLELYDDNGELMGHCTGTFIGPDAVLTAGHCLYGDGGWTADIAVTPGRNESYEPYGYQFASDWWVPDQWIDSGQEPEWDWGVIRMPSSNLGITVGWLSIANLTTESLASSDLTPAIVGYPGDKPDGTMWGGIKPSFTAVGDVTIEHDIDTYPGQSGSAVFSANLDGDFLGYVVGIHVRGSATFGNEASRIDALLLDDLLVACQVMGCTIDYVVEQAPLPVPAPQPALPFRRTLGAIAHD